MTLLNLLILLIVSAILGSLGAAIAGADNKGCLTNIVVGFAGALIGMWLSSKTGIHDFLYFRQIPVIWSVIGAALFIGVVQMLAGNKRKKK
ncbi:GlsB/YeaQ/YmgE family stress response membrane protein [candidate division KSB1 bacterium]|nr:GlsB/YeaQ/YmgE family stress response membrane protein [candidate division KSB1 bacterium]